MGVVRHTILDWTMHFLVLSLSAWPVLPTCQHWTASFFVMFLIRWY